MEGKTIHQNLSTSFINLPALLRHLRGVQFIGTVRLEMSSYEAEIVFTAANRLQAREYDRLAGRIAQGEKIFKRILERAKDPAGRITVVQAEAEETAAHIRKAFVDDRIVAEARQSAFGRADTVVEDLALATAQPVTAASSEAVALATELIQTVKEPFDRVKMDFETAFAAACFAQSENYPFVAPEKGKFAFRDETLKLIGKIPTDDLFDAVVAVLTHMIGRLRGDARFGKLLIYTRHRLQQHFSTRHDDYSRLGLVQTVDRILA